MNLFHRFWKPKSPDPNYNPALDIGIGRRQPIQNDYAFATPFPASLSTHGVKQVAVLAHIFYPDLGAEVKRAIHHIPVTADLFISTDTEEKREQIVTTFSDYANGSVEVRVLPNRGRDIAPKLVGFADVYDRYDYFLHIHTKKTLFDDKLTGWRPYLYENLLGSPEIVNSILALLQCDEIGAVFPQHYPQTRPAVHWGHCFRRSRALLEECGVTLRQTMPLEFPSGSMFWGKSKAFRLLLDHKLQFSDFEEEAGQTDGTLAHAVEHSFLYFVEAAGYLWAKVATATAYSPAEALLAVAASEDILLNLKKVYRPLFLETPDPERKLVRLAVREVTEIEYKLIKQPPDLTGRDVLLFVAYHPSGLLSRHVRRLLEAYRGAGIEVFLLSVVDSLESASPSTDLDHLSGYLIRANHGYDFSIWAHTLKLFPGLYEARTLLFANDSVFGPLDLKEFDAIIQRIRSSSADLIALTDSNETQYHFQSYFWALKNRNNAFSAMKVFWNKVRSIPHKKTVISQYEFALQKYATEHGIRSEALFPVARIKGTKYQGNPSLLLWKELIASGFPFVKAQLIREHPPGTSTAGLDTLLRSKGYDTSIIDEHLALRQQARQ